MPGAPAAEENQPQVRSVITYLVPCPIVVAHAQERMPDQATAPEPLRPFDARMLDVGDGHWLYVEEVGRTDGAPALFLHGGPGSGAQHAHRALFDPKRIHALLFDQRGAGRSHPYLSLQANTTAASRCRHRAHPRAFCYRALARRRRLVGLDLGARLRRGAPGARDGARAACRVSRHARGGPLGVRRRPEAVPPRSLRRFRRASARGRAGRSASGLSRPPRRSRSGRARPRRAHLGRVRARALQACARRRRGSSGPRTRGACRRRRSSRRTTSATTSSCGRDNCSRCRPAQRHSRRHRARALRSLVPAASAAFALCEAWPGCRLQIMESAGHCMSEPGVAEAMAEAVRALAG